MRGLRRGQVRAVWMLAVLALASAAHATHLRLDRVAATSQGFVYVEFEIVSPFEGTYDEALRSGLPTTLSYTIQAWQQRSGWWDKLESTVELRFRIFRDPLNDLYHVFTPERETLRFTHLDSLTTFVSHIARDAPNNSPPYFDRRLFQDGKTYYIVVTATLSPLTVEDLNELDSWLRGTLSGRDDGTGGIAGFTRTMGGMIMSMTGFGDKQVKARSRAFEVATLPREQPPPNTPAAPPTPERRVASPDSSAGP